MEDIERMEQDAEMLRNPRNWPLWPLLPVKRALGTPGGDTGVLAHLTNFEEPSTLWFYLGQNIFSFDPAGEREELTDIGIEAFLDKGWKVD